MHRRGRVLETLTSDFSVGLGHDPDPQLYTGSLNWVTGSLGHEVTALYWVVDSNGTTVSSGDTLNDYWTLVRVTGSGQEVSGSVGHEVTALYWVVDSNGTTVSSGDTLNDYWTLVRVSQLTARHRAAVQYVCLSVELLHTGHFVYRSPC